MSVIETLGRIEALNRDLAQFWRTAHGWAPIEAAGLLSKSRLDWQVSLSSCLRLWIRTLPDRLEDGELILAWANLGSLTEGTLKLFLSVFYHDYQKDIDGLKAARVYHYKKQAPISPDGLTLDVMRVYFKKRELLGPEIDAYVELVQQRRNAIHAYDRHTVHEESRHTPRCSEADRGRTGGPATAKSSAHASPQQMASSMNLRARSGLVALAGVT